MTNTKDDRLKRVNQLLECIASCGRRFFSDRGAGQIASFRLDDRGRVWYLDDFTGKLLWTAHARMPRGFSHGGTLNGLVSNLASFIRSGQRLPTWLLSEESHWGYGEDMVRVARIARDLGIVLIPEVSRTPEFDGWVTEWPAVEPA